MNARARVAAVAAAVAAAVGCSPPSGGDAAVDGGAGCPNGPAQSDQACSAPAGVQCAGTLAQDCTGAYVRSYCECAASGRWVCATPPCDAGARD